MTTDKETLKQIAKVKAAMENSKAEATPKSSKKTEKKDDDIPSLFRLPASMMFLTFMLSGMGALTVVNDLFEAPDVWLGFVLILFMIPLTISPIIIYALAYYEREHANTEKANERLRRAIDRTEIDFWNEFQDKYEFTLDYMRENRTELASVNKKVEEIYNWMQHELGNT